MEFRIPKSSDNQNYRDSFDLGFQELANIPYPDDMSIDTEGSPEEEDEDNELLLPPGTTREDFPDLPPTLSALRNEIPKPLSSKSFNISNNLFPSLPQNQSLDNNSKLLQSKSEDFNILSLSENTEQKPNVSTDELQEDVLSKSGDFLDDCKYSPSKVDSDDENQDSMTIKPKVLGKEQAKKRLMAFSLSKLPSVSFKKQNKLITPAKNKEKPPNPNKGSSVQEQFRATISAIEEEKKIMFQNMRGYLPILEISELAKSSQSLQLLDKTKTDNFDSKSKGNSGKDGSTFDKPSEGKHRRSYRRSRSQSKNKKPEKSRGKRRNKSRIRISRSRSRRRSYSKSRNRKSEEKNYKSENKTPRESQLAQKKKAFEDWDTFKAAGMVVESESSAIKSRSDESKSRRDEHHRRSRSPNGQSECKPIFNYLTKNSSPMTSLQVKPADSGSPAPVFSEKIIKYTRTRPILCWSENPSHATEFYMSQQMLLENCDETTASIVLSIVERRNLEENGVLEEPKTKSRSWYPNEDYLMPFAPKHSSPNVDESQPLQKALEGDEENQIKNEVEVDAGTADSMIKPSFERKISLVNDSYLSDEEEQTEITVKNTKLLLDVEINQVKVRSKWDSDYEGDASERDIKEKMTDDKVETMGLVPQAKDKLVDDFDVAPCDEIVYVSPVNKKTTSLSLGSSKVSRPESPSLNVFDGNAGNLVSEYEEFLKMVSVDSSDIHDNDNDNQKDKVSKDLKKKREKPKMKKSSKSKEEVKQFRSPKLGITDWDQESDHEETSRHDKIQFPNSESYDEFSILRKSEVMDVTFEKIKKKLVKKKIDKEILKRKKLLKKSSKTKKKKFEDSVSESSTESDSDSDSDESISSKNKKKKKKKSKTKRRSKKEPSSESYSDDSDDSKERKKKLVKKKGKKKKSSSSSSSSSSSVDHGEVQTTLLKQLDFKKNLLIKKIEEIDYVSDKGAKKKECLGKKMESSNTDSEKHVKTGKKKKSGAKIGREKKKSKYGKKVKVLRKTKKMRKSISSSESDSDSESNSENMKKKKVKKSGKRKRSTSESSDSDERVKSKSSNKTKKDKKLKRDSSVSESEDIDDSFKQRKKSKKENKIESGDEKLTELSFKDDLILEKPGIKPEGLAWNCRKSWKEKNKKSKEGVDWETSSSTEESKEERKTRDSSWDEEAENIEKKISVHEDGMSKTDKRKTHTVPEKESSVNNSTHTSDPHIHLSSEALKTSLSNFSFNENSFCSFGQELSRDFFLAERSYSNSGFMGNSDTLRPTLIEPRPFQSVSRDSESKKPTDSELYSPGYSDSDLSESEMCKPDYGSNFSTVDGSVREDVYDPLNCDSEGSGEHNEVEVSSIPLPHVPNTSFSVGVKNFDNTSSNSEGSALKNVQRNETDISGIKMPCMTPSPAKSTYTTGDFTPVSDSRSPFADEKVTPTKRQVISVKGQQKLVSKAAAVFQDESDEENIEPLFHKEKSSETAQSETSLKEKSVDDEEKRRNEKETRKEEKEEDRDKKQKKEFRDRSKEESNEKEGRKRRSRSRESGKIYSRKTASPKKKRSKTPEMREKREIRSDSFEIEPLKSSIDSGELTDYVQPIPVLTSVEPSSEGLWSRSLVPSCDFPSSADNLIDHAESFDIYPSEETNFWYRNYERNIADRDNFSAEISRDYKIKKERRRSRSRSYSPRKKLQSKSPERRKRSRSPWRKSVSPKRREKSPFSPRRRSPKSWRYKISWSPDKRKRSSSRSPRRRRGSPLRRSRSSSPRKYRSPKYREESPRRKESSPRNFSPRDRFSPRKDARYLQTYPDNLQNRIPVIGTSNEDMQLKLSPSAMSFPRHLPDSSVTEPEMYSSFYEGEYTDEFGGRTYPEEVGINNLITVQSHEGEKPNSPERLSLDQRIELELGVQMSGSQAHSEQYQVCPPFQDMHQTHFQNSYTCDNISMNSENFYQNQNVQMNSDFNGQYFNGHQQQPQPSYGSFQQYSSTQPAQNSVLQVGNIVEVVPMLQQPPPPHPIAPKTPQIMQVGNVLQVVPSPKATPPVSSQGPHNYEASPLVKTQKATAVVAPSPAAPTPNPEAVLNPLIKAIQLEREKRKKEKENRRAEREARRKARQLRREAKLMSVNEKLKKSVQDEGLMLGQEVEDEELLDGLDVPSPPVPVEIITVSTISALPPAGKGILITAGFMPKPPSEKKEVKFADGVCPGEGTSTSGGEEIASPPPKPKLPKEKRFKKKKTKVKKKVKVQIIRQIIQEDDDEDDDLSPPPPPPGDPPLVFFAKFPFAGDAQFPVYQTQTTTTTLTTVQYPAQTFE